MEEDIIMKKNAKIAGWAYFLIIISSILMMPLEFKIAVPGDKAATIKNIIENESLMRIDLLYQLIMFAGVILLAVMLYELLKNVNKGFARTAMLLRVGEALTGYLTVFCGFAVLIVLKDKSLPAAESAALAGIFLDLKDAAYDMIMVLISLGTVIFCYLFLRSKFIPAFLAIWGLSGFLIMLAAALLKVMAVPAAGTVNMTAALVVILFELTIGLWLMIKGINTDAK